MLKFNKNKIFGLFSAVLSIFLFSSSCRAVEPVLLGYIMIKAISPKITNYGQLNDPLFVEENVFQEIPTVSHGVLYMRFVSDDGKIIGPWTEINDRNSLKAPENEGSYQIQYLIKSDDLGNILNYPNDDFGTFDESKFSNVFNGLVEDESFDPSGKVIPIVYKNDVIVIYNKSESKESEESQESEGYEESHESNEIQESERSNEFEGSKESEGSDEFNDSSELEESNEFNESKPVLENANNQESEQETSNEESSDESNQENIVLRGSKSDESKLENNGLEENSSDISNGNNISNEDSLGQSNPNNGNMTQFSSASPNYSSSDSTSSQSKNKSSSSNSKSSSSKSKSSSIKTSEDPSYLLAIMVGSFALAVICIIEQKKKSKIDELD